MTGIDVVKIVKTIIFICSFFYLHKENEPKESAANHLVTQA
jgi:hypothetical protein